MASLSISSSSTIIDSRAPLRQPSSSASATAASPSCISLPTLPPPPLPQQTRAAKATSYCRKIVRNFVTRATSEVPAATEVATADVSETVKSDQEPSVQEVPATNEFATTTEVANTETPDIVKSVQETWEKVEDKYAIGSLAFAGAVALWGTTGMISAIDRLPLVPGVLELVGIGYTGWFAYKNLIFKPDRENLFQKVKNTYRDILGTS